MTIRKDIEKNESAESKSPSLLDQVIKVLSRHMTHADSPLKMKNSEPVISAIDRPPLKPSKYRPLEISTTPKSDPPKLLPPKSTHKPISPSRPPQAPPHTEPDSSDSAYSTSEPESPGTLESDEEAEMMLGGADSGPPMLSAETSHERRHRPEREQVKAAKEVLMQRD